MNMATAPKIENPKDESKRGTTEDPPHVLSGVLERFKARAGRGCLKGQEGNVSGGTHRPRTVPAPSGRQTSASVRW